MVVMLFLHVCRQLLLGGYKSPREGTWLIGVVMFFRIAALQGGTPDGDRLRAANACALVVACLCMA